MFELPILIIVTIIFIISSFKILRKVNEISKKHKERVDYLEDYINSKS